MTDSKFIMAPSILAADFTILGKQIKAVEKAGAPYLHIDVCDGVFVPSISFGMPVIESIRPASGLFFDVHLMITQPEKYVEEFARCGADGITFHLEATEDPNAVIDLIHKCGKRAGISIKPGTDIEEVLPYLKSVELVLVMSVEPGFGGQKFMDGAYDRIKRLREYIDANHLNVIVEVDGGIDKKNAKKVIQSGANAIVSGSAVFDKGSIIRNVRKFIKIAEAIEAKKADQK
ncbi:MAG: ribulose-phosphate 3-epimerase [Lachnospiraceae bacterium]|nr:ribulose-phosphate 3-epimerase [Lachnospiraceae bacterium]